jgi:cysteine desulfuration protein SufE
MSLANRTEKIVKEFAALPTWEDRYKLLISRGKELGDLPDAKKTEEAKVRGCQSQVWLHARIDDHGKVQFEADSDAMIVKGLVSLLLSVYSNATPDEILSTSPDFLKQLGFETHLSPSRANGLYAMVRQILYFAHAFKTLAALKK